jgi:MFS superfamily sulfate permease-like transporter
VNGFTNAAALIIASSQLSKLFGVDVDKADHHYETVIRTVQEAFRFTHWPTLALAVLALAIMVVVRRVSRRVPGVLIAVVVTTLISWAVGFEHRERVALEQLRAPGALAAVQGYNGTQTRLGALASQKVALSDQLRRAEEQHGKASMQAERIRHSLSLLTLEAGALKGQAARIRAELRGLRLQKRGGSFVASGDGEGDGRTWRVKVREGPLDERAITLNAGGAVVGSVPRGLPGFRLPSEGINLALIPSLLAVAIIISLLGFMEAISIAKAMAAKTGQRLDPNRELLGQGLANIVGAFFRSYPVSGSFSRSAVNLQAGAVTGLSSVCATVVVVLTLLFFTPILYHLPQSVLAAIIMMAVVGLLNVHGFVHAWKAQRHDGIVSVITFAATLCFAPHLDRGIMIGVGLSVGLYLIRNMRPTMAALSRHADGSYRSTERWDLKQCRHVAVIRFSESLFFINVSYLEQRILDCMASMPELRHILLVGNGINELDASGEEMLSLMVTRVREAGCDLSVSGLNDSVLDVMRRTRLYETIGEDHIFRNVEAAVAMLYPGTHQGSDERHCPLLEAPLRGIPTAASAHVRREITDGPPTEPAEDPSEKGQDR